MVGDVGDEPYLDPLFGDLSFFRVSRLVRRFFNRGALEIETSRSEMLDK